MPARKKKTTSREGSSRRASRGSKRDKGAASEKKQAQAPEAQKKGKGFPIIGLGASAGGLEAIEKFFKDMPADQGMAFVVITHLDPSHASIMPELIQKHAQMTVVQVEDGMTIEENCVYVIPPDKNMGVVNGKLLLVKAEVRQGPRAPVNFFLRSLADDQGKNAVGVILSGMGMDGTEGIKAIKGALGMVMVQEPESAKYDSMPRNAIATGLADYVLPPEEMPEHLIKYVKRFVSVKIAKAAPPEEIPGKALNKIHLLLRSRTGHDFSGYKESTIIRRIQRRMDVHQIDSISRYLAFLDQDVNEVKVLFKELLIGVTSFFRDAEAFDALKKKALLQLIQSKPYNYNLRAWVPGCATGEEAYSLAMVIQECMDELKSELSVQIFATDIDDDAIARARNGLYPGDISADVGPERLEKFFESMDDSYQIGRKIREMVIFAPQSVTKDPPFTRMDLICCRNLLIYLLAELQNKLIPHFHYSLRPDGILFLGSSETVGTVGDLFMVVDNRWKIYRRKETSLPVQPPIPLDFGAQPKHESFVRHHPSPVQLVAEITEKYLVEHHTPPGVVIDEHGGVSYIHGRTGKFLEPPPGSPGPNNISEMAREGLKTRLPAMIHAAVKERKEVRNRLGVQQNGGFLPVNVTVKPLPESGIGGFFLVLFEELPVEQEKEDRNSSSPGEEGTGRISQLEEELRYTKESLQTTIEELQASNEELRSINEEYQSANEELQSSNEELNSSKEELQSLNEELETVNTELQGKNYELLRVNDDMKNLLDSVEIPTVFLDNRLHITRFTSHANKLINLRESDVGRPIGDLATRLRYGRLIEDAKNVLTSLASTEFEVETDDNRWYLVKIRPYRSADNVIEGLVMTFVDIHAQKKAVQCTEEILDTVREPFLVLDENLRVERANRSFYGTFQTTSEATVGRHVYDLGEREWDIPELRKLLGHIIPENTFFENFELEHAFKRIGRKKLLLNARKIGREEGRPESIMLAIEDITEKAGWKENIPTDR
jgi:two-component system CheB/CheR fusion protein